MAKTHSVAEKMRLFESTAQNWMKIDPHYQRQKSRPMNLVSGNISCMRNADIRGGSYWRRHQIRVGLSTTEIFRDHTQIWEAISSETSKIPVRPAILYDNMLPLVGLWVCDWLQNEWPRMTDRPWVALSCQNPFSPALLDSERLIFKK